MSLPVPLDDLRNEDEEFGETEAGVTAEPERICHWCGHICLGVTKL